MAVSYKRTTMCPWRAAAQYSKSPIGLDKEIRDFLSYIEPTEKEIAIRDNVINRLESMLSKVWPYAKLKVFGSFKTRLFLPTSDIDVVVFGYWSHLPLYTIENRLRESGLAYASRVIEQAKVPLIKYTDKTTGVKVDISFNSTSGLSGVEVVEKLMKEFVLLKPLVFVLKQFLKVRELNEVFSGGLSSYALIIMMANFFQHSPREYHTAPGNLGCLLMEFLELYGFQFNFLRNAICITGDGAYRRIGAQDFDDFSKLAIEDPVDAKNNVSRNSYCAMQVRFAFQMAFAMLSGCLLKKCAAGDTCESHLLKVVHVDRETVRYRAWLEANFDERGEPIASGHVSYCGFAMEDNSTATAAMMPLRPNWRSMPNLRVGDGARTSKRYHAHRHRAVERVQSGRPIRSTPTQWPQKKSLKKVVKKTVTKPRKRERTQKTVLS